tara:strand:+ start:7253 stop:7624 length:372 start_codon:yes stop_codon:yes gene_type:complete
LGGWLLGQSGASQLWHTAAADFAFVSVRVFRGRKIHFKNFIGFHDGLKLVRSVAGGCQEAVRTAGQVGDGAPGGTVSLTVSCCLRQPRIASGATRFGRLVARAQWGERTMVTGDLLWIIVNRG